jgi:hypothetical protein
VPAAGDHWLFARDAVAMFAPLCWHDCQVWFPDAGAQHFPDGRWSHGIKMKLKFTEATTDVFFLQWNISDYFYQNQDKLSNSLNGDEAIFPEFPGTPNMPPFDKLWMCLYARLGAIFLQDWNFEINMVHEYNCRDKKYKYGIFCPFCVNLNSSHFVQICIAPILI